MKDRIVKDAAVAVDVIEDRMRQIGTSRYQLAYELHQELGVKPHSADKRLARMFNDCASVDFGLLVKVAKQLGLRLTIGDDSK